VGEIRSTFDIIMEKTKGLTLSEEEKKAYKEQEMAGKVKGLVQKLLDGILDMDKLKIEVGALAENDKDMLIRMIREESIARIKLGGNNEPVLRVLEETTELDAAPIREFLKDFEGRLEREKGAREKRLNQRLEEQGISGSAVITNIKADPEWVQYVLEMREGFQEKLTSFCEKLSD